MMKFFKTLLLAGACLTVLSAGTAAANEKQNMEYWLEKAPIVMNSERIADYNGKIVDKLQSSVVDLTVYPVLVPQTTLMTLLNETTLPEGFVNGKPSTAEWQRQVMARLNPAAIKSMNEVRYGLITARANVRSAPTETPVFESETDREFDQLQSTILNPGEGVVVLHSSADGQWLFVQATTYRGWLPAEAVAMAERPVWLEYLTAKSFAVVTGSRLELTAEGKRVVVEMGTRLPAQNQDGTGTVRLPLRDGAGKARFVECRLPANADIHMGYLPYTREAVVRQAFKFKGQPYGWGGLKESVDCSSLIMDVYRCFGFTLPRDADQQETTAGATVQLNPTNAANALDAALPGQVLYMPGHTMLYLGKDDGKYWVIHALGSYGAADQNGTMQRIPVMQVVVSDLSMTRKDGHTFLDSLTAVKKMTRE